MRFHHYGFEVDNLEKNVRFYTKTLGFTIESQFHFMDEDIVFLERNGLRIELIENKEPVKGSHIGYEVEDLNEAMKVLDQTTLLEGPYQLRNGWQTVFYEGPCECVIELMEFS